MDEASKQALLSVVRSILLAVGTVLTTRGVLNADMVNQIVGAVTVAAPVLWGIWDKYRSEKKTQARVTEAAVTGVDPTKGSP